MNSATGTAQEQKPSPVQVTITPGTTISVSPDPIQISRSGNQEIEWLCSDPSFEVEFESTPFEHRRFNKNRPKSGKPRKTGNFKYSVTVGGQTLDPRVIIDP
jgi:hypothetical protein